MVIFSRPPRRPRVGVILSAACATALSACTIGAPVVKDNADSGVLPQPSIGAPAPQEPPYVPPPRDQEKPKGEPGSLDKELDDAVRAVVAAHGGVAAVAISGSGQNLSAGDAPGFASWSTIKVPIAIAALRKNPGMEGQAAAAIQVSSNEAAEALWNSVAPEDVEAVLAEGGTPVTVQRQRTRPEFSPFGQTQWSVPQQAQFASQLQCVSGAAPALDLMSGINSDQSYGLGTIPGARFKGGWGPSAGSGAYEVRQFGLVPNASGQQIAIAIAVQAGGGSYEAGQAMATELVAKLRGVLEAAPVAACG